jgi:hypothetical protein
MTKNILPGWGIAVFGLTEVIIGSLTLFAVMLSLLSGTSTKPPEVLIFVLTTSVISLSLGIGIFRKSLHSYHLLLFFSTVIIMSKILIFGKIIFLSGDLETAVPSPIKNIISIIYHSLLILYFIRPAIRKQFGEKRSVLFSLKSPFWRE